VGFEASAGDPRVQRLVGIGVPVTLWPFDFLKRIGKPLLVLQGSEDSFGPLPALRRLIEEIGPQARLVILPGADHLLAAHLGRLEETLYLEIGE
jgi:pimeloyl-ACP methyl ester carboxylesterase